MIVAEEPVLEGTFLTHFVEELGQCVFLNIPPLNTSCMLEGQQWLMM